MNVEEELSRSLWMDLPPIDVPSLAGSITTDVLVIGSGVARCARSPVRQRRVPPAFADNLMGAVPIG